MFASCIKAYDSQSNPGEFAVEREANAVYVYPTQSMNKDGSPNVIKSPLARTSINLVATNESMTKIVLAIANALTVGTGKTVVLGTLYNIPSDKHFTYSATSKPVYACLADLSDLCGQHISWQLLYDPVLLQYSLNGYGDSADIKGLLRQ